MKNRIIFPENCRLYEEQRKRLEGVIEGFPMDIIATDKKYGDYVVYPKLSFYSPFKNRRFLNSTNLTPTIESKFYTLKFDGDVEFKLSEFCPYDKLGNSGSDSFKLKSYQYSIYSDDRLKGKLWYSQSWMYPRIHSRSCSFSVDLRIPVNKLIDIHGKPLFHK